MKTSSPLDRTGEALVDRLAVIGIGLIGSSIARVAQSRGIAREVALADADPAVVARARALGLGTQCYETAAEAAAGADLIIVCVPVGACGAVAEAIGPALKPDAVISDVGSVKASIVRQMQPFLPDPARFIPAHPVAGTEYSGPDAGFAELFDNRWSILTPPQDAAADALALVQAFWTRAGANVEIMTPEHHDLVLAITSHLPHLIAYNIVGTAADLEEVTQSEVIKFSAGGFRDFTRIAASDPTMWRDVFLNNKDAVLEVLGRFSEDLAALQRSIRWADGEALFNLFTRTRAIRRGIIDVGQDTSSADFGRRGR